MAEARPPLRGHVEIERQRTLPFATAQIARFEIVEADERLVLNEHVYRLDMCLTPRPAAARARYQDHRNSDPFRPFGGVYLLPPGQGLEVQCVPGVTSSLVCELQADAVRQWLGAAVEWQGRHRRASLSCGAPVFQPLMWRLLGELRQPGLAHDSMIELIAAQLALEVGRFCANGQATTSGSSSSSHAGAGLAPWRLRRIDERLAEDGPSPALAELAGLCGISVRHLLRGFRASRGCTIGEHIAERRAEAAKVRLQGPGSIKAVARALGFNSAASFTYAFRRSTGLTPRAYRAVASVKIAARSR